MRSSTSRSGPGAAGGGGIEVKVDIIAGYGGCIPILERPGRSDPNRVAAAAAPESMLPPLRPYASCVT
jgi:hypothetical protein